MKQGFIFDNKSSEDYNLLFCNIGSSSDTNNEISVTDFTTFKPIDSDVEFFISSSNKSLTTTFTVCQYIDCQVTPFSVEDIEVIQRAFCRDDGFYPFKWIDDTEVNNVMYDAKIDITTEEIGSKIYGLKISVTTNRPYGYTPHVKTATLSANEKMTVIDYSSKVGTIPANLTIKCEDNGDYVISNLFNNKTKTIEIKNCTKGEEININELCVITTTLSSHDVADDFNYCYPELSNTLRTNKNYYSSNKPCTLTLKYKMARKAGI